MELSRWLLVLVSLWFCHIGEHCANAGFCIGKSNGLHGNPDDCSKYYQCWAGITYPAQCGAGLYFNPSNGACDWPGNVDCTPGTSSTTTTEIITTTTESTTTTDSTTTPTTTQSTTTTVVSTTTDSQPTNGEPLPASEFCNGKSAGFYACPQLCSKYYQCYSNTGILHTCTNGLYFNGAVSVCDWPSNVNCQSTGEGTVTTTTVAPTPTPSACSHDNCVAPACYCPTTSIPLGLQKNEIPQIVLLTFDDAVTIVVDEFFKEIFNSTRLNPNGCQVTGTFFLSDKNTDYNIIRRLASEGHEIADHSCNHVTPTSEEQWKHEIMCQKHNIENETSSLSNKVTGWRSPFLALGGNTQFKALYDNEFKYDSSIAFGFNGSPVWPFTLDVPYHGPCNVPPCPTDSFPGLFEFPLLAYKDKAGYECSMFDGCSSPPETVQETFELFKSNFHRHYDTNKSPFPAYGHASFFVGRPYRLQGYLQFLDYVMTKSDVYVVSVEKAVDWMKQPTKLADLQNLASWQC